MKKQAGRRVGAIRIGSAMRPRRWYNDEVAPQRRHTISVTSQTWRYQALVRGTKADAAPVAGAASVR
jgi:hypothetical protein